MEGLAMLRQFIAQFQYFWELYGTLPYHHWCLLGLDNTSIEDDLSIIETGRKHRAFKMIEANRSLPIKRPRRETNRKRKSCIICSTKAMEPHIWKDLPEDLFEAVIAKLPIATIFRFRLVCQKWNSLLTSRSFSQHFAEAQQVLYPWFYIIDHENEGNNSVMYNPSLKKWHHPHMPPLLQKMIVLPVTSAGGLICFLDMGHRNFSVFNPLTNSFKSLPARPVYVWSRVAVGMVTINDGYKILWLGCNGDHEIYDSTENRWTHPGNIPPTVKLPLSLNFRSQPVPIESKLCFMRSDPDGILTYDVVSGAWKQFVIPLPRHLSDCALAESGGRLMLVGLLTKNAASCVGVWELQRMSLLWKEVDRMPNIWCLEFYGKHVRMSCLGNQGRLILLSLRSSQTNRLVTYDVSKKEWRKVATGRVAPCGARQWVVWGTAFNPCPAAVA
ncbi:F-box only protein 6 [Acorus gramineus]|uniref:F-box only protein 6 n=1 Tax=Acorus gramineus TaxID=55184 RepID=A0AAV9A6R6_ACOGR|nr:F-box only protein 6 [Acorus gramineus]